MNFHTTPSKKSDKTPHSEALEPDHVGDFTLLETASPIWLHTTPGIIQKEDDFPIIELILFRIDNQLQIDSDNRENE